MLYACIGFKLILSVECLSLPVSTGMAMRRPYSVKLAADRLHAFLLYIMSVRGWRQNLINMKNVKMKNPEVYVSPEVTGYRFVSEAGFCISGTASGEDSNPAIQSVCGDPCME